MTRKFLQSKRAESDLRKIKADSLKQWGAEKTKIIFCYSNQECIGWQTTLTWENHVMMCVKGYAVFQKADMSCFIALAVIASRLSEFHTNAASYSATSGSNKGTFFSSPDALKGVAFCVPEKHSTSAYFSHHSGHANVNTHCELIRGFGGLC